jgi:hypothetical protein
VQKTSRIEASDVVADGMGLLAAADEDAAFEVGLHWDELDRPVRLAAQARTGLARPSPT